MERLLAVLTLLMSAAGAGRAAGPAEPWLQVSADALGAPVPQGVTFNIRVELDIDAGYHLNANPPTPSYLIPVVVEPEPSPVVRWGKVWYPEGQALTLPWTGGESISVYTGRTFIFVEATAADDAPLDETTLRLKLRFQGCSETTCFQPSSRDLAATFRIINKDAAAVPPWYEDQPQFALPYIDNLAYYLVSLIVFGLLLNLTPCVFPLVPVTMTFFAQQGESRPAKVLPLAVLYVMGLATTFTGVGVAAALAGRSMGLVLQSPAGVLGVVAVLAIVMASAFGAFDMRLPSGLAGRLGGRRGAMGAIFMGLVMGLVASPCVGPFLLALIAFIASEGSVLLGAISFFVTGLGLGIPYIFLGTFTGLVNRFPRGGGWLIWTKRLLGMTMAGLILYYVEPLLAAWFFWPLVLATFIFAGIYLGVLEGFSRRPLGRTFWAVRLATGAAILVAGVLVYAHATANRPEVQWQPWTPESIAAARTEGRPVLLYFGADWCIACKEWHAKVFSNPQVIRDTKDVIRIYVDVTRPDEEVGKFAERFQALNPPAVILIDRTGRARIAWRTPPAVDDFLREIGNAAQPPPVWGSVRPG